MASSIDSVFNYRDVSLIILNDENEDSSEHLRNRLVCTQWKAYSDELIQFFWNSLRQVDPKGVVDIGQAMDSIEAKHPANTPAILKFAKLMDVFKKHGSPIANPSSVSVTISDIRELQNEYDVALRTVWPRLREIPQISQIAGLPDLNASAAEIRSFLNKNKNILEAIQDLNLADLDLTLVPPELQLCKGLRTLKIGKNRLTNISCLAALTNLTHLALHNNQLTDKGVSCLATLTNLIRLNLSKNQLKDVSCLAALTKLTDLLLDKNQLTDLSWLAALTNLTSLSLGNNQLKDVSWLTALTNLTSLGLDKNQLKDVSCLAALTNLKLLGLNNNQLTDVSCLAALINLKYLGLDNNQLTDVSSLKTLIKAEIYLEGNPCEQRGLSSLGKRPYDEISQ